MATRPRDYRFLLAAAAVVVVSYYGGRHLFVRTSEVNVHDPAAQRISTFELQPGEVGAKVRVRLGRGPAAGVTVWAERDRDDDEDGADVERRKGQTDAAGLVRVPVRKGSHRDTRLFARDAVGRVAGGTLGAETLLSAPDLVLAEVAPLTGRLLTSDGKPITGAVLTAESFVARLPGPEDPVPYIGVPETLREEYTARTDADGRFSLPGVPVGYGCQAAFRTTGYGEGELTLPAGWDGECRLAAAGGVQVDVSGDGTAAAVARLRCGLVSTDWTGRAPGKLHVDGARWTRHDGTRGFILANVVPGEYVLELIGTPRHPVLPARTVPVTVAPGRTAVVVVPLKQAGRVEGQAVDGKSGMGIKGVHVGILLEPSGEDSPAYNGSLVSDDGGRFSGYVPAGVPFRLVPEQCPRGYASSRGRRALPTELGKPLTVAAGETQAVRPIELYRHGTIRGTVVADGRPVAGAAVEVRWDASQVRPPATLTTDRAGQFEVPNAPPGQPALIRVRSGDLVNGKALFDADELAGAITVPLAAGDAFRVHGRVTDRRGQPIARARVVIVAMVLPPNHPVQPPANDGPDDGGVLEKSGFTSFAPAELEALFTDADGRFRSGPLWPGCGYSLTVSADGLAPRRLQEVHGRPGQMFEVPPVVLSGTSAAVVGTVVGADGRPLAGATVINSGDAPKRLSVATDAAGRFALAGLYDGPAVVVAHKPGYRRGYAVARPGEPEPRIVLHPVADPPTAAPVFSEAHRRAEADLVRRLSAIAGKEPGLPAGRPAFPDPWAEARKDLDGYLAKHTKDTDLGSVYHFAGLACELGKQDRAKARRVLRFAADAARRLRLPDRETTVPGMGDLTAITRLQALAKVAEAAADVGESADAAAWLAEAEALAAKQPDFQRQGLTGELAAAWVTLDPARTERLLAATGPFAREPALSAILERLLKGDVRRALPWLVRFPHPGNDMAQSYRARIALRLAESDLPQALRLAGALESPVYRGVALAALAPAVARSDPKGAHVLIDKATIALAADPTEEDQRSLRLGATVYLLWQAEAVKYPDLGSVVAVALTSRPPVAAQYHEPETWRSELVHLALGVGSLDPAAGRALLGADFDPAAEADDPTGLVALALAEPAAAARHVDDKLHPYAARLILTVLKRRSAVLDQFELLRDFWWVRGEQERPDGDDP